MNAPKLLIDSIEFLKGIVDNVEDLALLNALNSKVANLVSLKGCTFKQFSNSSPRTMSYYCMSFMHSGTNKDYMVDCINDHLLGFVKSEMDWHISDYKQQYELEQMEVRKGKNAEKEIMAELDKIRVANLEIANPNYTGLYREAEQITKTGFGSLYVRMGELGDYLENIASGDKTKKELYQKLKDIFEGTFYPTIIAGDGKRETLKNIPVQAYLYTDFDNLYKDKNREIYISSLKTGMARRSFIYIPENENKKISYPKRYDLKEDSFYKAVEIQKQFKNIFDMIRTKTVYTLSEESKELLYQYQCQCIDYFNNSNDNIIVKLEKKESFWKITKLAVVYSIVDNPSNTVVSSQYVQMAIDFYNLISPSLKRVIEKRKKSEIETYAEYIANHKEEVITRTDLRNLNIINGNKFKKFFEEHFDEVKEELENVYGLLLYPYENGKGNVRAFQCVKKG